MNQTTDTVTDTEIADRVRSALSKVLGEQVAALDPEQNLAQTFGDRYDSLAAMECVVQVEGEFGIEVDFVAHDVRHWFSSLALITAFVRDQLEDQALLRGKG
ncbi:MAG: acyl carrier protein [Catenulispora sp.]